MPKWNNRISRNQSAKLRMFTDKNYFLAMGYGLIMLRYDAIVVKNL
jgi:hypothetical protein